MRPLHRITEVVSVLLGALLILGAAIYNGYPLVFSDSGTYLRSAFEHYYPFDRPYYYGVFIRMTSGGGATLWGVVVVQALMGSWLLHRCWHLISDDRIALKALLSIALLSLFTPLPWYAGQLMPDIFTAWGGIAVMLLLLDRESTLRRFRYSVIVLLSCWFHYSNLLILPLLLLGLILFAYRRGILVGPSISRIALIAVLPLAIAWGSIPFLNRAISGHLEYSAGSHVFLMGRLLDSGMLKEVLDERCATEDWKLCAYKDQLPPNANRLMFAPDTPMEKEGGWRATQGEYNAIFSVTLTTPKYVWWHFHEGLRSTVVQMAQHDIAPELITSWYASSDGPPYQMIDKHVAHELPAFLTARQGSERLHLTTLNMIYFALLIAAHLLLVWIIFSGRWRNLSTNTQALVVTGIALQVANAVVVANLSMISARFQGRVAWVIVFVAALAVLELWPHFGIRRDRRPEQDRIR